MAKPFVDVHLSAWFLTGLEQFSIAWMPNLA